MSNASNYQKAIVMLSAEPLDNGYLDEFSPRLAAVVASVERDLSVAPTWFPREVADAETIAQFQPRWSRSDSIIVTGVAAAVIGAVAYFTSWEIGAFLVAAGLMQVVTSLKKGR